jgi:hypothetical protein
MESTAIAEEMFSQISAEECERRWSVIRKYLTNAQIAKTFPPWTDHEKTLLVNTVKHALEAPEETTFVKIVNIGEQRVKTISWTNIAAALHRDIEDVNYQWNCYRLSNFKRGPFSVQEDLIIIRRYQEWSLISDDLKPRTGLWVALEKELNREDKRISERWRSILSKRVESMQEELLRADPKLMSNAMAAAVAAANATSGANSTNNNNAGAANSGNGGGNSGNSGILQAMGPPLLGAAGLVPFVDNAVHLAHMQQSMVSMSTEQLQQLQEQLQQHQQQQQHSEHVAQLQLLVSQGLLSSADAAATANRSSGDNATGISAGSATGNTDPYSLYHHHSENSLQKTAAAAQAGHFEPHTLHPMSLDPHQQHQLAHGHSHLQSLGEQQQQQQQQRLAAIELNNQGYETHARALHFDTSPFDVLQQAQQRAYDESREDLNVSENAAAMYEAASRKPMVSPDSYVNYIANQQQRQMVKLNAAAAGKRSSVSGGRKDGDKGTEDSYTALLQRQQQQQLLPHLQHHGYHVHHGHQYPPQQQMHQSHQHHHLYGGSASPTTMLSSVNAGDSNSPNDNLHSLMDKAPSIRWNTEMDDVLREAYKRFESDWKQIAAYVNEHMPASARLGTMVDDNKCRGRWYRSIRHHDGDNQSSGSTGSLGLSNNNLTFAHHQQPQQIPPHMMHHSRHHPHHHPHHLMTPHQQQQQQQGMYHHVATQQQHMTSHPGMIPSAGSESMYGIHSHHVAHHHLQQQQQQVPSSQSAVLMDPSGVLPVEHDHHQQHQEQDQLHHHHQQQQLQQHNMLAAVLLEDATHLHQQQQQHEQKRQCMSDHVLQLHQHHQQHQQ